jgi:hypothetical protein
MVGRRIVIPLSEVDDFLSNDAITRSSGLKILFEHLQTSLEHCVTAKALGSG